MSRDTLPFSTLRDKSWKDLALLWGVTLVVGGLHETAHGVTCRHYGARVSAMGFALVYLRRPFTPIPPKAWCFAGLWSASSSRWRGSGQNSILARSPPSSGGAVLPVPRSMTSPYVLVLMTGIATILLNWNPLMKLDGYHILCDLLGILDLKEDSTAFVSAWVKRHIWRLPVEVPYVPKRRRLGFAVYAIASGLYSYTVLYIVARLVGNIFRNFNPEWSFVPGTGHRRP